MRNADLYILVHKMQKFAFKLFLCFLFTGYFFSAPVNAYWNSDSVDCKLGTVNEKKLTEKGLTKEQIEKAKATKKAEYEFCLAKKQIADKVAEKEDAGYIDFVYEAEFDPKHFNKINEDGTVEQGNTGDKISYGITATPISAQQLLKNVQKSYPTMYKNLANKAQAYNALMEGGACGPRYPHGCPADMKCMTKESVQYADSVSTVGQLHQEETECRNITDMNLGWHNAAKDPNKRQDSLTMNIAGNTTGVKTDSHGNTTQEVHLVTENVPETPKLIDITRVEGSNASCNIDGMRKKYQSSCYSCIIVKTLITTFIDACSNAEQVTTEAAVIILQIGLMLWITFFVLQQISSFTNIEPAAMINTLFVTLFKCLVAYVVIVSGVATFTTYVIEPIMNAGASYGIALLEASPSHLELTPSTTYVTKGTKVVSPQLINDIMGFTESMDKTVSTNLIIGHSLTCHSINAGAWRWTLTLVGKEAFTLAIPNFWIWLCGAAIWFCGFMLTLGFSYYLLDISFKMGFAVIAFPILMALWPFKPTASKLKSCVQMIIKAAGTFMMLGMTGSYALILVSKSIRNLDEFYKRIEAGDSEWISETFALTGPYFIIIVFAYLYSLKLIGSTVKDYVDRFFEGGIINKTPMHTEMTRMTDIAKKATVGAGKKVIKTTAKLGGKVTSKVANKAFSAAKFVKSKFKGKDEKDKENALSATGSAVQGAGTATKNSGKAVKQTGKATKQTGKAVEQSGKAVEQTGKAVEGAGKATAQGGDSLMQAGQSITGGTYGIGAIVGVPMMIAGAAMKAGGTAVEYTGKAAQAVGKGVQTVGKSIKFAGTSIEKAGLAVEKAGAKMEKQGQSLKQKGNLMGKKKNGSNSDVSNDDDVNDDNDNADEADNQ